MVVFFLSGIGFIVGLLFAALWGSVMAVSGYPLPTYEQVYGLAGIFSALGSMLGLVGLMLWG